MAVDTVVEWLNRSWAVMRRGWWRFAVVAAGMMVASVAAVLGTSAFLPTLVYAQRGLIVDETGTGVTVHGVLLVLVELGVPLGLLVVALLAGSLSTVAVLGADLLAGRPPRVIASIVRGSSRVPALAGALSLVALLLFLSLLLTPVLVAVGVLGLLLTPLVRQTPARWPVRARWPRVRVFVTLALPFATTAVLAVWWGLVIPRAVLGRCSPGQALRRSRELVSRRFWSTALSLLVGAVVYWGSQLAVTGLTAAGVGDDIVLALRVVSQALLVAIPVVIATVVDRGLSGGGERSDPLGPVDLARTVGRGVTSGVLVLALVGGLLIPLAGSPGAARAEQRDVDPGVEQLVDGLLGDGSDPLSEAAAEEEGEAVEGGAALDDGEPGIEPGSEPVDAGSPGAETFGAVPLGEEGGPEGEAPAEEAPQGIAAVPVPPAGFLVTSLGDQDDQAPGDGLCADVAGECTLRAAITEANAWPDLAQEITFALGGTIALSAPLVASVSMSIDGVGHRVTIGGGSAVQLLRFTEDVSDFTLRGLTLSNGRAGTNGGGAVESSAAGGTIDSVTFVGNSSTAAGGAVAVHSGNLWFVNATFWQNSAPQGSDIANLGGVVSVDLSTFVPRSGVALHNAGAGWQFIVYFSLIDGGCTGEIWGGANHAHSTCPRRDDQPVAGLGTFGDHGGPVDTVALDYLSPAVDAYPPDGSGGEGGEGGEGGPARVDARGIDRPQGGSHQMDFGAFELEGGGPPAPADEGPWYSWIVVDSSSSSGSSEFGEAVTFSATVMASRPSTAPPDAPEPTGSVIFRLGEAELSTVALDEGVASITLDRLAVGENQITAEYSGDAHYYAPPATHPHLHVVNPIATSLSLASTPTSTVTGQQATFTAVVSAASPGGPLLKGDISFWARLEGSPYTTPLGDVAVDTAGAATISTSDLGTGPREVTAYFTPATSDYRGSELMIGHLVEAASTKTELSASADDPVFRQSVTFTAAVSAVSPGKGVPTGEVEFSDGSLTVSRPVVAGTASYTTGMLDFGSSTMTARYLPTPSDTPAYTASQDSADIEVQKAATVIAAGSTPATSAVGQEVTLRADVTAAAPGGGTPGGSVEFRRGSDVLGTATIDSGVAILPTGLLPVGLHQITVAYGGDAHYRPSSSEYEHRVSPVATRVDVSTDSSTAVTGQPVRYTALVNTTGAGTATLSGTVEFGGLVSGTATLDADGRAVLETVVPPSSQDSATVSATFNPDNALSASSSGFVTQNLSPAGVTVSVTAPSAPVALGEPLRLEVDVVGVPPSAMRPGSGDIVVSKAGLTLATVPVTSAGTATVTLATLGGLGVGSHTLTVVYRNGIGYLDGVTSVVRSVTPAASEVNLLVAPEGAAGYGVPVTATVLVAAPYGLEPNGVLSVYDGDTLLHSSFVARIGGGWGMSFDTDELAVGDHRLRAVYDSWNSSLGSSSTVQDTPYTVQPIPTTTTLVVGPRLIGDQLNWSVLVRADRGHRPSGSVRITVDGQALPSVTLQEDPGDSTLSSATVTAPESLSQQPGSYPVVVEYLPTGPFAASSDQRVQEIYFYLPTVTLGARTAPGSGPWLGAVGGIAWGEPVEIRAQVDDRAAAPDAPAATGKIVIDGGVDGVSCTLDQPSHSCVLVWPVSGNFTVTAHYEGDGNYGADSSTVLYSTIDRKTPAFRTVGLREQPVVTGEPATAVWAIDGPEADEGTVHVDFGAAPGCTTSGSSGSCVSSYGLGAAGQPQQVTVRYSQNSRWNAISRSIPVTPLGCYPLRLVAAPAEGGTLTALTAPNCNDGGGYRDGTEVWIRPVATAHEQNGHRWRFDGFSPALAGPGADYAVRVGRGPGETTRVDARFALEISCVTVRVTPQFSTSTARLQALGTPDCPVPDAVHRELGQWQHAASGGFTGRFLLGSEVRTGVLLGGAEDTVYGYRWGSAIAPVTQRSASSFIAERDTQVWVLAGPRCYPVEVTHTGAGTVTTTADRSGCHNPGQPAGRWTAGTVLEVKAAPDYRDLNYVARWNGVDPGSASTFTAHESISSPRIGESVRYTVEAGQDPAHLSVHFGTCRQLIVEPIVQGQVQGRVDAQPAPNCPVASSRDGLYEEGSEVLLHAVTDNPEETGIVQKTAFGKWNVGDAGDEDPERTVVLDRDITLTPSFYARSSAECVSVRLVSDDPSRVRVSLTESSFEQDRICGHGTLGDGPGSELEGSINRSLEPAVRLHSELVAGDPLMGWELAVPGKGRLGQLGADLEITGVRSAITATSYACQAIEPLVTLRMESGEVITERAEAGSELIMTNPAPNCPYAEDAWIVGTTVELAALGDPSGYGFTGWSGAATGSTLATTVHLDGASPVVTVTAAYDVTCYTLTLTHDAKDVTAYPAPNCRGTDAAQNRYIGGTLVSMYGEVPGGKVWQGWTGDLVQTGKVNPAFIVMDDDKSAGHRWRSKDWDEELVGGLEWFGDQVAIVGKKAVGVLALAVKELGGSALSAVPPFALIAAVAPTLALVGTILELAGVSEDITKYLHYANETYDWMFSTLSCAASWSFASSGGGGAGAGRSTPEEAARKALEAYDAVGTTRDTADLVVDARKAYFGAAKLAAKGTSKAAAVGGFALTVGVDVAATILDTGIGWEKDAESAWTDGSVFTDCMGDSVPSYLQGTVDDVIGG